MWSYVFQKKGIAMNLQQAYLNISSKIPVDDIKVKQRLDRGYDMVRLNGQGYTIVGYVDLGQWQVHKASTSLLEDNSHSYDVSLTDCTCPDFTSARGGLCKHRLAVMLLTEMEKEMMPEDR